MKKNIFAVCDLEVDYACNFMDYLNQKKNIPFEIQAFTSTASLLSFGREKHIELLLISQKAMDPAVKELDVGKIIILSEGVHPPELDQYPSVYKYQSSADVIREVIACYGEEKAVSTAQFPVLKKTTEILGVYSPLGRCLKTSFALTLGQILARNKAVLYLNLEEYAGFEELMGRSFSHNLSDLLYYVRQENQNLMLRMRAMTQNIGNLDYLPPVQTPADIQGTSWEDWDRLLQEIILHSDYEIVILDIGTGVEEVFHLLEQCKTIFMPVLPDVMSRCKLAQFEKLLKVWDYAEVLSRIVEIHPPFHAGNVAAESYVEQLPWGELGDYVKEILREEHM